MVSCAGGGKARNASSPGDGGTRPVPALDPPLASFLFSCHAEGRHTRLAPCDAARARDRARALASVRAEALDLGGTVRRAGRFAGWSRATHCRRANGCQNRDSIAEFLDCNDRRDRGGLNGDVMRKSIWVVLAVAIRIGCGNAVPAGSGLAVPGHGSAWLRASHATRRQEHMHGARRSWHPADTRCDSSRGTLARWTSSARGRSRHGRRSASRPPGSSSLRSMALNRQSEAR